MNSIISTPKSSVASSVIGFPVRTIKASLSPEGIDGLAGVLCGLQDLGGVVAVQIDAADIGLREDFQLGGEVVLKVGMLDGGDMVGADVQEAGGGEAGAQGAVVLQGLARHLHGQIVHPGGHGIAEVALQIQRLRSGEVGLKSLHTVIGVDGGDHTALGLLFSLLIGVQNILKVISGGRFTLSTGNADDIQGLGGVVIAQIGQGSDGAAHIADQNTGQIHLGIGGQRDVGHGPLVLRHGEKLGFEMGALTDEEGAGNHAAGVVGDKRDLLRPVQSLGQGSDEVVLLQQDEVVVECMFHGNTSKDYLMKMSRRGRRQASTLRSARTAMASV